MKEEKFKPTLEWIRNYWMVIIFVVSSIMIWTTTKNTVDGHTEDIKVLKSSDITSTQINNQILVELSAIRTDLLWIKQNVNK